MTGLDHLVYATPDLERTVEELDERLGVRASAGGQHPGRGTRNALISLGPRMYLEIVGPDPSQPEPQGPRWFGIDSLTGPRLVAWAAATDNLAAVSAKAASHAVRLGPVITGGRTRPDGIRLQWNVTDPTTFVGDGLVPFFIDWGTSPHPAESATPGVELVDFRGEHPDAMEIRGMLQALGVSLPVEPGSVARLIATLRGRHGEVQLAQ